MDTSIKESWYLKSVTICLVIAIGSCFPFAAMLAIPLILYKSKKNKKINLQLQEKLDDFIKKHEYMFGDAESKLKKLNEDITNKELLKAQIVSEATAEADDLVKSHGGLIATNTSVYEPHFYSNKEIAELPVRILGRVVEMRRKF